MRVLTIRQPWAALIASGQKPIENRGWRTSYRGPIAIHAAQRLDVAAWDGPGMRQAIEGALKGQPDCIHATGAIVAIADLVDIHPGDDECSPWAQPVKWHWVLVDAKLLPEPIACPGQLSLWVPGDDVLAALKAVAA